MTASEVLVDDQLVEALRKGLPLQGDRLSRALAAWRDDARLDESVREAIVSAATGAATTPAGALRCDGPESAPADRTDDLSPRSPRAPPPDRMTPIGPAAAPTLAGKPPATARSGRRPTPLRRPTGPRSVRATARRWPRAAW